jgi:hypothetical protein
MRIPRRHSHGQTLVELALVLPLLVMFLVGIIAFGMGVFYQQQLNNAVREAARYAAIHSATDPFCPVASWLPPDDSWAIKVPDYEPCDRPNNGWPGMRDAAREASFGLDRSALRVAACWSGYWRVSAPGIKIAGAYDEPADVPGVEWFNCHIAGIDPRTNSNALACPATTTAPDDEASDVPGNHVTVYACYTWSPPLAGFLLLPDSMVLRAVSTEVIHRQR